MYFRCTYRVVLTDAHTASAIDPRAGGVECGHTQARRNNLALLTLSASFYLTTVATNVSAGVSCPFLTSIWRSRAVLERDEAAVEDIGSEQFQVDVGEAGEGRLPPRTTSRRSSRPCPARPDPAATKDHPRYTTSTDLSTPVRRGMTAQVTSRPAAAQHLRDLARLRRVRDRIDREYAQPLDVEALARGAHMSAGHFSRQFRLAYGESPYAYLMTRRVERAMALLRRGDLSVTEVCFAVGCSSLGTFSSRFTELVGVPPSVYRRQAARATAGMPSCVAKQVTRPIRGREARLTEPQLS